MEHWILDHFRPIRIAENIVKSDYEENFAVVWSKLCSCERNALDCFSAFSQCPQIENDQTFQNRNFSHINKQKHIATIMKMITILKRLGANGRIYRQRQQFYWTLRIYQARRSTMHNKTHVMSKRTLADEVVRWSDRERWILRTIVMPFGSVKEIRSLVSSLTIRSDRPNIWRFRPTRSNWRINHKFNQLS